MADDDDAKARFDALKADNARQRQMEAERQRIAADRQTDFVRSVDDVFTPIFRTKAVALDAPDDPVTLGPRALFYHNCTLYYKPLWNQVLWQIPGHDIYEHQREETRGNYVYLGLIRKVLDHHARTWVEKDLKGLYLREFSRSEPLWGRVTRQEKVTGVTHYEGGSQVTSKTWFPVERINETSDSIVQGFVEAMVRQAG